MVRPAGAFADAGFDYSASFSRRAAALTCVSSQMHDMLGISAANLALNQPVSQENCNYGNIDMNKAGPTLLYDGSKIRWKRLCNAR